jgi:hypothetical protein
MVRSPLIPAKLLTKYNLEYTVYSCPTAVAEEISRIFKHSLLETYPNLTIPDIVSKVKIIVTWQQSQVSLLELSPQVKNEQDRLFLNFQTFYDTLVNLANETDTWVNASSPYSGEPLSGVPTAFTHNELETLTLLQNLPHQSVGCCGLVLHPTFQEYGYPITIFTTIDVQLLKF